jgi:hypothetical protein
VRHLPVYLLVFVRGRAVKRAAGYLVWAVLFVFVVAFVVGLVAAPGPAEDEADYHPPLCEHPDLCGICMYKNPFREAQVPALQRELMEKRRKAAARNIQPYTPLPGR